MEKKTLDPKELTLPFRVKVAILLLLCLQNAGHALLARYSQVLLCYN
jgi:hypothetical protein